jgi:hypothetical protein
MKSFSLKNLSDFRFIAESILTDAEMKSLLKDIHFFYAPDSDNYQSIQDHSELVDSILGFRINEIELELKTAAQILLPEGDVTSWGKKIHSGSQSWVGLNPRQLLTPYHELFEMCQLLEPAPGSLMVDVGAGYARMAFVLHQFEPLARFTGYEIVNERVEESKRMLKKYELNNAEMMTQDLSSDSFILPVADFYLLYDFGTPEHIRATLLTLKNIAFKHPVKIIARGRMRQIIDNEHPWLSQVFPPVHRPTFSLYSSF